MDGCSMLYYVVVLKLQKIAIPQVLEFCSVPRCWKVFRTMLPWLAQQLCTLIRWPLLMGQGRGFTHLLFTPSNRRRWARLKQVKEMTNATELSVLEVLRPWELVNPRQHSCLSWTTMEHLREAPSTQRKCIKTACPWGVTAGFPWISFVPLVPCCLATQMTYSRQPPERVPPLMILKTWLFGKAEALIRLSAGK